MSNYSSATGPTNGPGGVQSQPVSAAQPRPAVRTVPSSWIAPAIVATLCFFAPTGVVAVYFAAQVNSYWNSGDQAGAVTASKRARSWVLITLLAWVLFTVFMVATGRMGALFESGVLTGR